MALDALQLGDGVPAERMLRPLRQEEVPMGFDGSPDLGFMGDYTAWAKAPQLPSSTTRLTARGLPGRLGLAVSPPTILSLPNWRIF